MTPSPIVEFWIQKDRFSIEVDDKGGIDLAPINRPQDRDHRFRRFKATQIDMDRVGRSPYPGFFRRSNVSHDDTSLICINKYHNA
jgi:hypothetical protein